MRKVFASFCLFCSLGLFAQDMEALIKGERVAYEGKQQIKSKRTGQSYDLTYQSLKLNIDPGVREIAGSVYSELTSLEEAFSQFSFDLDQRMIVDSVRIDNEPVVFQHTDDEIILTVPEVNRGARLNVEIFYHGDPSVNEQKGFSFDYQPDGPISWTLSEPYGAYGWWPCKQQLFDKIDSLDMYITIPKGNKAAGMGTLVGVDTLIDSSMVYHWQHRYPISTYLVAVAVTNYYEESHYIQLSDGDSVLHLDYLYPAYKPQADTLRWAIDGMMRGFDSLFGAYPFRNEKYGHAMFGRGGGMEHQTMSFMSRLDFDLMAHELAHQWFGNKITCGSWQDLWLNEGWATYANAIARELIQSDDQYKDFLAQSINRATRNNGGSVYAYDTISVANLFDGDMRYRKGAMVLHQLRWTIGDSAFFEGTKQYLADASICYGFAHTPDFIHAMEDASGQDLTAFFDRYVYQEGFPKLDIRWNRMNANTVSLKVNQTTSHPSVDFFPLAIQCRAIWEGGDTLFILNHDQLENDYQLILGHKIIAVEIDPNYWLLAKHTLIEGEHEDTDAVVLYPNPVESTLHVFLLDKKMDTIEIIDMLGRKVGSYNVLENKNRTVRIDVSQLRSGPYTVRLSAEGNLSTLRMIKK